MKNKNLHRPHIVKFKDGNYAIRKLYQGEFVYFDMFDQDVWWLRDTDCFKKYCRCTMLSVTRKVFHRIFSKDITDYGEPID